MFIGNREFWRQRRVLLTGHTGFKGSWLAYWLHLLGASVTGYAHPPETEPSLFRLLALDELVPTHYGEINDTTALIGLLDRERPEFVFHLAAQAQVLPSYADPGATFATNVMGCVAVLDAVRTCDSVRVCQIVTSDKCYAQPGAGQPFVEGDPLGGNDPYSASKAAAEIAVAAYRSAYFSGRQACSISTVRAGNALGAGDWSGQRMFPNSIRALRSGRAIAVTHGQAVRPWQHVLEPLSGYLSLAQHQYGTPRAFDQAWNFGPEPTSAVSVLALARRIVQAWGCGSVECGEPAEAYQQEAYLAISIAKARQHLAWRPAYDLGQTVAVTVNGYRHLYEAMEWPDPKQHVRALCASEIAAYAQAARRKEIAWATNHLGGITGAAA